MMLDRVTTAELKKMNRRKVFLSIYEKEETSKQAISESLKLSIPTVSQNIKELERMDLIGKNGLFASTGGRPPQIISFNAIARIAIGIELLKEKINIAAIDLYGRALNESVLVMRFENSDPYFLKMGTWINAFIDSLPYPKEQILGVGIAIQGLISPDGETITYSEILKCTGLRKEEISKYINYPSILIHDSKASAFAELWHNKKITDAVYIALNRNLGGAVILNSMIYQGQNLRSGTIEHMHLLPSEKQCYCGKYGCFEVFCSANSLQETAGGDIGNFFRKVRENDTHCVDLWQQYLRNLALGINNIRRLLDCDILIGGFLQPYLTATDIEILKKNIIQNSAFFDDQFDIHLGYYKEKASMIGAALQFVEKFLNEI